MHPSPTLRLGLVLLALPLLGGCGGSDAAPSPEARVEILRARTQGLAFLQQDRLPEARAEFERLTELAPREAAGPANLALVALREGRLEEALELADEALERASDDAAIRLERAAILDALGAPEEARAEREAALALDPANLEALWALAGGSSDLDGFNAPPDRGARLEALLARTPASLPVRFELVALHLEGGDAEAAAVQLEEIRRLVPQFPLDGETLFDRALTSA
ncbi:MAG: tetratricopeptide repeat protein, partial [Longimicrobiales bacterium]|nr:tetratricopeptide repeat protein [Longimicrobiales bacterium]